MTMLQLLAENNDRLSDVDLAHLAAWAHRSATDTPKHSTGKKRAYSLLREGADLLLRESTMDKAMIAAWTSKNPSMADLTQDPRESIQGILDTFSTQETL
jgi:hypothetical protein